MELQRVKAIEQDTLDQIVDVIATQSRLPPIIGVGEVHVIAARTGRNPRTGAAELRVRNTSDRSSAASRLRCHPNSVAYLRAYPSQLPGKWQH